MAMNYSDKVMEHFTNPQNVGEIENASGCGTVGNAVCGDIMSHMPVTNDAWDEGQGAYDYSPIFAQAAPYLQAADYAVANLETTLSETGPYSGYPAFKSPAAVSALGRTAILCPMFAAAKPE